MHSENLQQSRILWLFMQEFKKKGFPIIRIYEDHFDVKALDYWEFRSFRFDEVVNIQYRDNTSAFTFSLLGYYLSQMDPYSLIIYKSNGGDWKYECPGQDDAEFHSILSLLMEKCGIPRH